MSQQDLVQQEDSARPDDVPPHEDGPQHVQARPGRVSRVLSWLKSWRGVVLVVVVVAAVVLGGPAVRSWWSGPSLDVARTWESSASDKGLDGTTLTLNLNGTGRAAAFPMVGSDGSCEADTAAVYTGTVTWEKTGRGEIRVSGDGGRVSTIWTGGLFSGIDWSTVHVGVCGRGTPSNDVHVLAGS